MSCAWHCLSAGSSQDGADTDEAFLKWAGPAGRGVSGVASRRRGSYLIIPGLLMCGCVYRMHGVVRAHARVFLDVLSCVRERAWIANPQNSPECLFWNHVGRSSDSACVDSRGNLSPALIESRGTEGKLTCFPRRSTAVKNRKRQTIQRWSSVPIFLPSTTLSSFLRCCFCAWYGSRGHF